MSAKLKLLAVAVLLLFIVAIPLSCRLMNAPADDTGPAVKYYTMADYNRVQTGMSRAQVAGIMGDNGEERNRTEVGSIMVMAYSWQNPDGSGMIGTFQGDRLVSKAQTGLK